MFCESLYLYRRKHMGFVYTEVTLKNAGDSIRFGNNSEPEIRKKTVQALVDTGCFTLVISEELRRELGLELREERRVTLVNRTTEMCKYTEAVEIHWKNRSAVMRALVLPGAENVLLGALPLEEMDLIVDTVRQELTGAHGDEWAGFVMRLEPNSAKA
jgi:clan AA aspartic protease